MKFTNCKDQTDDIISLVKVANCVNVDFSSP